MMPPRRFSGLTTVPAAWPTGRRLTLWRSSDGMTNPTVT